MNFVLLALEVDLKPIIVSNVLSVSIFSYFNNFLIENIIVKAPFAFSFLSRLLEVLVVSS